MKIIQSKKHKDLVPGGRADKKQPKDFDQDQLKKGIFTELEHTDDRSLAKEIAMDHLTEDPKYYDHLQEMEDKYVKKASVPEYSMDNFKPGTLVTFVLNGKKMSKRVLFTDTKNGRVVVELGGKNVGIPESRVKIEEEPEERIADIPLPEANFPRSIAKSEVVFNLTKEAKKKKKWDPNPWAICETSVGKKKNPKKFERCVKKIKNKQK